MAFQNILQGKFTGKLGELSGSTWKGKAIVKSAPFSQKPHSNAQTQSVRAFECCNRLCSGIAKAGFHKLGLSSKNMHPHNAVAKWLKPIVKNHVFEPQNIKEVIPPSNNFTVTGFTYNMSTGRMIIDIRKNPSYVQKDFENLFIIVFNEIGKCYFSICRHSGNFTTAITLDHSHNFVYSLILFTTYQQGKKYIAENFLYKRGTGMKYSYEEQATGDIWFDGRPIYQNTIRLVLPAIQDGINDVISTVTMQYTINLVRVEQVLFATGTTISTASPTFLNAQSSPMNPLFHVNISFIHDNNTLCIRRSRASPLVNTGMPAFPAAFTIFYTKPSDQPVVDG